MGTDSQDGRAEPRRASPLFCTNCGGTGPPMPLLDTRQGRNFRLFRCTGCDKLEWREEQ